MARKRARTSNDFILVMLYFTTSILERTRIVQRSLQFWWFRCTRIVSSGNSSMHQNCYSGNSGTYQNCSRISFLRHMNWIRLYSFIPDILNSIKIIFRLNGCQGTRIWTLFFEINLLCCWNDRLKTSAIEITSHLCRSAILKTADFAVSSPHFTQSK